MNADELSAVSRISPALAMVLVIGLVAMPMLVPLLDWLGRVSAWGRTADKAADPGVDSQVMGLIDQLQEEVRRVRALSDSYAAMLDQLRMARLTLFGEAQTLFSAAIAARAMVHQLQRQMGVPETPFDPLPELRPPGGTGAPTAAISLPEPSLRGS
jgi:hypothetical protein